MKGNIIKSILIILLLFLLTFSYFINKSNEKEVFDLKKDFGVIGDGIKDSSIKLQEAINSVPSGSTLIIPKGIYKLTNINKYVVTTDYGQSCSAIKITKDITIKMEKAILKIDYDENCGMFWVKDTSNVSIIGGSLIGEKIPHEALLSSRIGILVQNSENVLIKDIYIRNMSQGINLYFSRKSKISNVKTEFNKGSGIILFRSRNSLVENSFIRNSGDGHLSLYGGGRNNIVTNCIVLEDRENKNNQQGITVESEKSSIIENSMVNGFYYGIDLKNGADNNIIRNNTTMNNQFNITIRPGDSGGNLKTVSNNNEIIENNIFSSRRFHPNGGILIGAGEGHEVKNNIFYNNNLIIFGESVTNNKDLQTITIADNIFQ